MRDVIRNNLVSSQSNHPLRNIIIRPCPSTMSDTIDKSYERGIGKVVTDLSTINSPTSTNAAYGTESGAVGVASGKSTTVPSTSKRSYDSDDDNQKLHTRTDNGGSGA